MAFLAPITLPGDLVTLSSLLSTFWKLDIWIDDTMLHSWKLSELANVEVLLTVPIHNSQNSSHQTLASLALITAYLPWQWNAAISDARGVSCSALPHAVTNLHQVHQNSAIHPWLHCKECNPCW